MKVMLIRYHPEGDINTEAPNSLMDEAGVVPPLGIAYIAAVLEKGGHNVVILDCMALKLSEEETLKKIMEYKPQVVGVTAMSTTIRGALKAASLAKKSGAIVIMGGPHTSANPKEIMSYNFIDYCIWGEGEYPMLDLVNALEKNESINHIKGLIYRKEKEICINPPYFVDNLDGLPYPARHLLPVEKYSVIIALHPIATIVSSRGCPFQCENCSKDINHNKYRVRDPKKFVDEMEYLIKNYKVKEIIIIDDTLTLNKNNITAICKEIINRNIKIKWESPTRVDCVDPELLKLMYKAGCRRLRYGVESGDQEILSLMKKGITLKQVEDAFKWTKKAKIEAFAYFMIGYRNETEETIKKTIKFAKKIKADMAMFTVATPLPNSEFYKIAQEEGYVEKDYWAKFTLGQTNERLPYLVKDADKWVQKAYYSFYLRPSYILKRALKIRSFDEIKKSFSALKGLISFKMIDHGA